MRQSDMAGSTEERTKPIIDKVAAGAEMTPGSGTDTTVPAGTQTGAADLAGRIREFC